MPTIRGLLLGAAAAGAAVAAVTATAGSTPSALPLKACVVQGLNARCGTFTVPESRARPDGRKIGLNVVVIPATRKPAREDAFTYLAGGPGGAATGVASWIVQNFAQVHATRDILLVDQRGTGVSHPLACAYPSHPLKTPAQAREYARSCFRSVRADVSQYGTRTAMDDLDAVRAALGYRQFDVYGASYGATAAQVYLKRHPSSVRTLVLDGATAMDIPLFSRFAVNAQAALARVATRCAADAACRRAFPGWRATFSKLVRAWDEKPVHTRKNETTTGAGLAGVVQAMLLDAATAAEIPLVVSRAAVGDYGPLNRNIQSGDGSLNVMYYTIWCNEPWVGLNAHGPWHTDFDGTTNESLAHHREICAYFPKRAEPGSAWTMPHSKIPVLVLAGGADPQDPISNMPRLEQAFPNGRAIVVPHFGHTVAQHGCLGAVASRFVESANAKTLDTRCVNALRPPGFFFR